MAKKAVCVRITPEAVSLLKQVAATLGISQAAVIEIALRKLTREGFNEQVIQIPPLSQSETD
jgi:hypothetical protein